jgi:hypothetical protein
LDAAIVHARAGRMISAIRLLEELNPGLGREKAKATVRSFGYGREVRWPETEIRYMRCL